MNQGIFVTGTDTGIGKTIVSSLLVSALKSSGRKCGYFKPIQTGSDHDFETLKKLANLTDEECPRPTYLYEEPAAPYLAANNLGESLQLDRVLKDWQALSSRFWVVEGVGGLLVPL